MTFEQFQEAVVRQARSAGLTEYELYYMENDSSSLSAMEGDICESSSDVTAGCCFRCRVNQRMGSCSTELFTPEEAERIVSRAARNALVMEKSAEIPLFAGSGEYKTVPAAPREEIDSRALALELYERTVAADERVQSSSQSFADHSRCRIRLVNSAGLDLSSEADRLMVYQSAVVRSGEEQFDGSAFVCLPQGQPDAAAIAAEAVEKALDKIGGKSVPSGKYVLVFDREAFGDLLSAFASVFSAKNAQQGLSLLAGKEGQVIASECVTITDDPFCPGFEMPFDGEGVAARAKTVIEKGVFKTLLHNRETAAKAGRETTGNASRAAYDAGVDVAPFSFYLQGGEFTREELLRQAGSGLLITELAGLHAGLNPVTGDFSLMAAGYRIEDGKRGDYVTGITVSGNFFQLLREIRAVGNDLRFGMPYGFTRVGSPSVLTNEMAVAGE